MILRYNPARVRYEIAIAYGPNWHTELDTIKAAGGWRFDPGTKSWYNGDREKARQFIEYAAEGVRELLEAPDPIEDEEITERTGIRCFLCGVELLKDVGTSTRYSQMYLFCPNCDWFGFQEDYAYEDQLASESALSKNKRKPGQAAMDFGEDEDLI